MLDSKQKVNQSLTIPWSHRVPYRVNNQVIPGLLLFAVSLYLANPVLGLILGFGVLLSQSKPSEQSVRLLFLMISVFFALWNTTRIPESDLLRYQLHFESASSESFSSYMSMYSTEVLYYAANYLLNVLLLGNFKLYLVFVTMLQYMLRFAAAKKIFGKDNARVLALVGILALTDGLIFTSVHLLRQMIAASLFMFFFAEKYASKRILWWIIPVSFLIHSSSLLLYALCFIPYLESRISLKLMFFLVAAFVAFILFGSAAVIFFIQITSPVSWLNYPFARLQDLEINNYGWFYGLTGTTGIYNSARFVILPIVIYYFFRREANKLNYVVNFTLLYFGILMWFYATNLHYMVMRMSVYMQLFYCIAIPLMLDSIRVRFGRIAYAFGAIMVVSFFVYRFSKGYINTDFLVLEASTLAVRPLIVYVLELFM